MNRLHPLMFVGTGSDVGKSVLATAFCRILKQDGYSPAPFKAQNMALNSFATPEGLEIGRAQAVQAEAAGIACHTDMNPILLKPQSDHTSQVVLNGRPIGNRSAYDYFRTEGREGLRREVCAAYDRLAARYHPIVLEGAGSISEINLRETDLVNMPMARHAGADVFLVGDIDRGGVFGAVYGSLALLREDERRMVKGIFINKFRGDLRLFESGREQLERLCGVPVLGVIPYFKDIVIEDEDSVALARKSMEAERGKVNMAVVLLRHMSNFTDFNAVEQDPRVHLFYTNNVHELAKADIIVLPGSKCTIDDLAELRRNGVAGALLRARREGATLLGICGGYQMMGQEILDPEHIEGETERFPGLGLLPVSTTLTREKVTRQVAVPLKAPLNPPKTAPLNPPKRGTCDEAYESYKSYNLTGYEIHNGRTVLLNPPKTAPSKAPLNPPKGGTSDTTADISSPFGGVEGAVLGGLSGAFEGALGTYLDPHCMGTYLHGILDNQPFLDFLLRPFAERVAQREAFDYRAFKEEQYDRLAAHVRRYTDIPLLYNILSHD